MKIGVIAKKTKVPFGFSPNFLIKELLKREIDVVLDERLRSEMKDFAFLSLAKFDFSSDLSECEKIFVFDWDDSISSRYDLNKIIWCPDRLLSEKRIWTLQESNQFVEIERRKTHGNLNWISGIIPGPNRLFIPFESSEVFDAGVVVFDEHNIKLSEILSTGKKILLVGNISEGMQQELINEVERNNKLIFFVPWIRDGFNEDHLKKCRNVIFYLNSEVPTFKVRSAIEQIYYYKKFLWYLGETDQAIFPQLARFGDKPIDESCTALFSDIINNNVYVRTI